MSIELRVVHLLDTQKASGYIWFERCGLIVEEEPAIIGCHGELIDHMTNFG